MCLTCRADDLKALEQWESKPFEGILLRALRQRLRAKVLEIGMHFKGLVDCADMALERLADQLQADPLALVAQLLPDVRPAPVVVWQWPRDERREVMVPPKHMLLVRSPAPFRVTLAAGDHTKLQQVSLPAEGGFHFTLLMPLSVPDNRHRRYRLKITIYHGDRVERGDGPVRYLCASAKEAIPVRYLRRHIRHANPLFLDTNGRGAMLRAPLRWAELTSRYDALLAGNINPDFPEDRWVMLARCRLWVIYQGFSTEINGNCFEQFVVQPGAGGVWCFVVPTGQGQFVRLRIGVAMVPERNAMGLLFYREKAQGVARCLESEWPVWVIVRPDVEDRNFHDTTKAHTGPERAFRQAFKDEGDHFTFGQDERRQLKVAVEGARFHSEPEWLYMVHRPLEAGRGLDPYSDLFSPGYFQFELGGGDHTLLTATMAESEALPGEFQRSISALTTAHLGDDDFSADVALKAALGAFIVRRAPFKSVIAGYPWFLDWGRDALIVVRGMIAAGMIEEARAVLLQFGRFEEKGTLPNMIHGQSAGNRDTSDAPLWFFTACRDLLRAEGANRFLDQSCGDRTLGNVLRDMAQAIIEGTPNGVHMDRDSGLVFSPTHFTWMDTNHPAGTPREGYPIEIQALWYAALSFLADIDNEKGQWRTLADQVQQSIARYYALPGLGYLSDCLHAPAGVSAREAEADDALRPNQLLAVTLNAVEDETLKQTVVLACQELIVPGAIRSLADRPVRRPLPIIRHGKTLNDPHHPYQGRYTGDEDARRKPAYHNGTAWTWLFPSFCEAWAIAFGHSPEARAAARDWLQSAVDLMADGCVGQIPEILDGDAPHTPRGCDAQAWGVSEVLRALRLMDNDDA
jgi:predicted glycogen debranching enzyme